MRGYSGFRLALADLRFEWVSAACYALALAAVFGPLLVLYGLKFGVIESMTQRLLNDPSNLELTVVANRSYTPAFFADMRADPRVGFIMPRTRSLSATLYFRTPDANWENADLEPTGPGDPLIEPDLDPPLGYRQVVLTHRLATRIGAEVGGTVETAVSRHEDVQRRLRDLTLEVRRVLAPERSDRLAAFVPLELLTAIEDYRDGHAVERLGWPGPKGNRDERRAYASFRLYASSLEAVVPLADSLQARGIDVVSAVEDIRFVQTLDRNLDQVFAIVAVLGSAGVLVSLAASLWSNVERKRVSLSVLRLLGVRSTTLLAFPISQAAVIALAGAGLSFALYGLSSLAINAFFRIPSMPDGSICRLAWYHFGVAAAAMLIGAVLAAGSAAWRTRNVAPWEGMRDG